MKQLKHINIVGDVYGKYKIIDDLGMINGRRFVICEHTEKGNIKKCNFYDLRKGKINGKKGEHLITHGGAMNKEKLYQIWRGMKARCLNSNDNHYHLYGGRGIKIEWSTYEDFRNDMQYGYEKGLSIDRIDVNGNYSKENCRWANIDTQSFNRRNNRIITYKGVSKPLGKWATDLGIKRATLSNRINTYGWSIEKSLTYNK